MQVKSIAEFSTFIKLSFAIMNFVSSILNGRLDRFYCARCCFLYMLERQSFHVEADPDHKIRMCLQTFNFLISPPK